MQNYTFFRKAYLDDLPKAKVAERSVEPIVTLDEVRAHLNLFGDMSYDAELTLMIDVAQQNVEDFLGEYLGETVIVQPLQTFPSLVKLRHRKISGFQSISYRSTDGTTKDVPSASYIYDDTGEDKFIKLANGSSWPTDLDTTNYVYPVQLTYEAQWETPPLPITQAILMTVSELFNKRDISDARNLREVPVAVSRLLQAHVRI